MGLSCASFILSYLGRLAFPSSICDLFVPSFRGTLTFLLLVSGLLTGLVIDSGDGVTHVVINLHLCYVITMLITMMMLLLGSISYLSV